MQHGHWQPPPPPPPKKGMSGATIALIAVASVILWAGACAVCLMPRGEPQEQAEAPAKRNEHDGYEALRLLRAEYLCADKAIGQCPSPLSSVASVDVFEGVDGKGTYRWANVKTSMWPKDDNKPDAARLCNNMLFATFANLRYANVFASNGARLARCRHPHR